MKQHCNGHLHPGRGGGTCHIGAVWRLDWRDHNERVAHTTHACAQHLHQVAKEVASTTRHADVLVSLLSTDQ